LLQGEDGFGATVFLAQLFRSSSTILKKLVNDDLLERFKLLIKKCGPQGRLINLFASTCFVEGRPMRGFQEACVRKLWMNPLDRYNIAVTFHETTAEAVVKAYAGHSPLRFPYGLPACVGNTPRGGGGETDGDINSNKVHGGVMGMFGMSGGGASKPMVCHGAKAFRPHLRYSPSVVPPDCYLGKEDSNEYPPVGVVWRSNPSTSWGETEGQDDRGGLFWSPSNLEIPSLGKHFYPKGTFVNSEVHLGLLTY
jgi:hypothetical protein